MISRGMKQEYHKTQRGQLRVVSSWSTRVWDDWLKNGTPYHDSDTFVELQNFKDAVQFRTLVLAVEIDEPTTKKVRECDSNETQLILQ